MNQKGFANIIILIVAIIAIAGIGGYFVLNRQAPLPEPTPSPNLIDNSNATPTSTPISSSTSKSTSTSTSTPIGTGGKIVFKYHIQIPENQKIGGQVGFQVVPEDKNLKVHEAGPIVSFTLHKPDGSTLETKSSLNYFAIPDCAPPPPGIPAACGEGFWVAGTGISFDNFRYYDKAGKYKVTASDNQVRAASFEVRDSQLGYLLIDVNGYRKTRISETIADGGANLESFIVATYQGAPLQEVSVDVFTETSTENAKKRFDSIAEFHPKINFEGQTIAVFENSSSFTAEWISGTYQISISTQQKATTMNAQDVLRAYLKKYPSSLPLQ